MPINAGLRRAALLFVAGACTSLAGCGVAEEARKRLDELATAHGGSFQNVTRRPVEGAMDNRTFLLRAEARKSAHRYQAWAAFHDLPGGYCADGVPFVVLRESPVHEPGANQPGEYTWHPAGTVFEQEIRCTDLFSGQRVVAEDADALAELKAIRAKLAAGAEFDSNRHLVTSITFNQRQSKYHAASQAIGGMILGSQHRCRDAGVTVQRILVRAKPAPDPSEDMFMSRSEGLVGADIVCADGLPPDDRF